ncbi:MAG: protocadherin [Pirellulales bacterium]|nr:protocadherin [Pirellulales bacterium]
MARQSLLIALTVSLMLCLPLADCWGRGFGGGRSFGGGRGGGGFGGGFSGGYHNFGAGGGGFSRGGGFSGGIRGGSFGGAGGRSSSGGFSSDSHGGSFGGGGSRGGNFGGGERSTGEFGGGRFGSSGTGAAGAGGGRIGGGAGFGGQRSGIGADSFGRGGTGSPSRTQLNSFLGLPSDSGLHHLSGAAAGAGGVGRPGVGAGGAGRPGVGVGGFGRPGIGVGDAGRPGVGVGGAGFNRVSPSKRYTNAAAVRGNFNHWSVYGAGWYTAHPGAWHPAGWGAGVAWRAASWSFVGAWMNYYPSAPVYYDYGNNITYQDDSVYMNGQDQGTSGQYYQQAQNLANTGAQAQTTDEQWMPLGVFALTKTGQTSSDVTIQLAVDKQGVIRGNYTDTKTGKTQLVQGSVDKQTQRVAFTVGDNKSNIVETGLYNLTKDEAPVLIHFGKDRTEQWLLVRLKQHEGQAKNSG